MIDLLPRVLLVSLPNMASIVLGIALIGTIFPTKNKATWVALWAAALCLVLASASVFLGRLVVPLLSEQSILLGQIPLQIVFILLLVACIPLVLFAFDLSVWDALFCCTGGYALQNVAHSIGEVVSFLLRYAGIHLDSVGDTWVCLIPVPFLYVAAYMFVIKNLQASRLTSVGDKRILFMVILVILINIVVDTIIRSLSSVGVESSIVLVLRLSHVGMCCCALFLEWELLCNNRLKLDSVAIRQMMSDERKQYELSRDTIDAINMRCHDIRHQIRQAQSGERVPTSDFFEDLAHEVDIYDSAIHTNNRSLDTILTEKSLICQHRNISFSCVADGTTLGFMSEADVYSLFGNALDNAISATEQLDSADRRIITLSVDRSGDMARISVRNFYEGNLDFSDGLPITTKRSGLHGYGMRSMRLNIEKYGGTLSVSADGQIFRLSAIVPIP